MQVQTDIIVHKKLCIGTSLRWTPLGPTKVSVTERVSSGQGFIIHYEGRVLAGIMKPNESIAIIPTPQHTIVKKTPTIIVCT